MTINKSGRWWVGSTPDDLREYLVALSEESYKVDEFRLASCTCGYNEFLVEFDATESCVRRTCSKCGLVHFVCDSEDSWEDAEPEKWACCECSSTTANIGVGFSLYEDKTDIHWLYAGVRCSHCGVMGCVTDWKIGYGPSLQLIDKV